MKKFWIFLKCLRPWGTWGSMIAAAIVVGWFFPEVFGVERGSLASVALSGLGGFLVGMAWPATLDANKFYRLTGTRFY